MNEEIIEKKEETDSQIEQFSNCGKRLTEKESFYCFQCESKMTEGSMKLVKTSEAGPSPPVDFVDLEIIDEQLSMGYNRTMDFMDESSDRYFEYDWVVQDLRETCEEIDRLTTLYSHLGLSKANRAVKLYKEKIIEKIGSQSECEHEMDGGQEDKVWHCVKCGRSTEDAINDPNDEYKEEVST